MSSTPTAIREERERLEELRAKSEATALRAAAEIRAYTECLESLDRIMKSHTGDDDAAGDDAADDDEQLEEPAPETSTRSSTSTRSTSARSSRPSSPRPKPSSTSKRPAPLPSSDEEHPDAGRIIDIGVGRAELPDKNTNLTRCIDALRARSPHWLTTAGIHEVMCEQLGGELPEHIKEIIRQEMDKQRKLRPYTVPGLQARAVDARRFEYRITGQQKHDPD